jgi:hypothetical protein
MGFLLAKLQHATNQVGYRLNTQWFRQFLSHLRSNKDDPVILVVVTYTHRLFTQEVRFHLRFTITVRAGITNSLLIRLYELPVHSQRPQLKLLTGGCTIRTATSTCGLCMLEITTGRKGPLLWFPRLPVGTHEESQHAGRPLELQ